MQINEGLQPSGLLASIGHVFDLGAAKVRAIDRDWDTTTGSPVFTVEGRYTTRGWTEWTQGFQYGCAILVFDGTDDHEFFELGLGRTMELMLPHVTHAGVHDHGFNNLSTYGNLHRLARERRVPSAQGTEAICRTALKCSGAVQAMRWSPTADGAGYLYSFNGPHSLFVDTMRTIRVLGLAHRLGHHLMGENDVRIDLLSRAMQHGLATAKYSIFYGETDHVYDVRGRTAHEAVFNRNDGQFRCRSTQQGYSPFSTWTRGLAWAMLGFSEQLEFVDTLDPGEFETSTGLKKPLVIQAFQKAVRATCDHYLNDCAALDGVVYWDDGAPGLSKMIDWRERAADPFNDYEPVDSSASAIAAQGLIRLGRYLGRQEGSRYSQAGLSIAQTLFAEPYLSTSASHQGLLLHSVYHRPHGWDHVPRGRRIPCGESSMWGDYHLLELAILIKRLAEGGPYPTFFA